MLTNMVDASEPSTRQRLLAAGMRLFAERGYGRTTVGEIEEAAGFTARGGTMYRHFPSKTALLEAALEAHTTSVADVGGIAELLPLSDRRSEVELLGRWILAEMSRQREVTLLLEKDGDQIPGLRDRLRDDIRDAGYRWAVDHASSFAADDTWDLEAVVVLLAGALIDFRRSTWTFGAPPLGLTDDRILAVWDRLALVLLEALSAGEADE